MRLFDMVIFLVLLGGISGGFQYVQTDLSTDDGSSNWWSGYSANNMTTVVVDSDDVNAMKESNGIVASIEDFYNAVYFAVGLIWEIIKGVFYVKGSLLDHVIVFNDADGNNILEPINYALQGGVYIIAAFGWYQLKAKQPMGSGY